MMLLLIAVMLSAACGGMSDADIDATVEARVALAKASLVAPTPAPLPIHNDLEFPSQAE